MPEHPKPRTDIETPERIAKLPVDRGFPVPWFVASIDGKPDFRVIRQNGVSLALRMRCCWICGEALEKDKAYVAGPMCGINRTSSEPPSHRECAIYAALACPFLARPHMKRREAGLPEDGVKPAGESIMRNPGASVVWITRRVEPFQAPKPDGTMGILFDMGEDPSEVLWYANGREARREEVEYSIDTGIHHLRDAAEAEGPDAVAELERRMEFVRTLLPDVVPA